MPITSTPAEFPALPALRSAPAEPAELAAELRRIHAESVRYWTAYSTEEFFRRPAPGVWAPVDQVRHLTKVVRAVTKGLRLPRPLMLLLFGLGRSPSRSIESLQAAYKALLGRGGGAGGFAPRPLGPAELTTDERARQMALHAAAIEEFAHVLSRWRQGSLDRWRLPHPLLGKLTVREMVHFTLLHNVHHVAVAERRRRELADPSRSA